MNTENAIELDEDLIEILLQIGWVVKDNHGELMFTVKGEEELMKYVEDQLTSRVEPEQIANMKKIQQSLKTSGDKVDKLLDELGVEK